MARILPPIIKQRARALRAGDTDPEAILWHHLRNRLLNGFKFRRQAPIAGFIADFACHEERLIVELDGSQHAESRYDARRDAALMAAGYRVVRFWNQEVTDNTEAVLEHIVALLEGRG